MQASHRLLVLSCLSCLSLASVKDRERAKSGGQGFENYINQIERKGIRYTYLHHLKNSINSFYPSILWQEKRRRNEPDRERYVRAARYASQEGRDTPSRGKFHSDLLLATREDQDEQSDRPTATKSSTCTRQGPGENELEARRKDGRRKIWTTLHSLSTLHSCIPHTLTLSSPFTSIKTTRIYLRHTC